MLPLRRSMLGWLLLLAIFAGVAFAAFFVWFQLFITIAPNRTSDGHTVMPIGQAALALFAAPVTGFAVAFALRRRIR